MSMEQKLAGHAVTHAMDTGEDDGCECECSARTWPNILCGLGIGCGGFVILVSVLTLMKIPTIVDFILDVYCICIALVGMIAEFRRFKILRAMCYHIIKHVYWLTHYTARGLFYIFLGTIVFDEKSILNMICTGYCCTVGIMTILLNCKYNLPTYLDAAKLKEMQEERIRAEVEAQYAAAHQSVATAQDTAYGARNQATGAAAGAYGAASSQANQAGAYVAKENNSFGRNGTGASPNNSQNAYGGFDTPAHSGPQAPYAPPHLR